ncbi:sigma-B regulation protein RsbU (phosphoserine phosphatase) [Desulfatibacillum alkenivorans DSM 16219]|uniref:Sigma-B regulation protein RsbU (Phosphoserine phosphatase) n=1 Tax=Desulfatibacillum alkenivorans DSM 16219 TaxID=1121393 RepID=A0A1M6WHE8_9BACT|nr:SpoIIE family protein phosphatase [Desulfatibacillum alkenivorans]SHK93036.1 sigma-B regulation protein RsbU (phosphoserine phosphatase) [Desulfatibacillum alkenivorans DSM 16219]
MKLRWKVFLLLMIFSLVPLMVVTAISQKATKTAGNMLSRDSRAALLELSERALEVTVRNTAEIQKGLEAALEFRMASMARKAEYLYVMPAPASDASFYWKEDFNDPAKAPPDLAPHDGYEIRHMDGQITPYSISLDYPVIAAAPGVNPDEHPVDKAVLASLRDEFISAYKDGESRATACIALESGLFAAYPGHGEFPEGYDPRLKPWYRAALTQTSPDTPVTWTFPMVDEVTGQVVFAASTLIHDPEGKVVGVLCMDVLLEEVLNMAAMPSSWIGTVETYDLLVQNNPDNGKLGALVLAHDDYVTATRDWTGMIFTEWLDSQDKEIFHTILKSMEQGNTGVARLRCKGKDSIWAFAPVGRKYYKLLVTPMSSINSSIDKANEVVDSLTRKHLLVNFIAACWALLLGVIGAMIISRIFTKHIYQMIDAVKRLARGDFSVHMDFEISDERGELITAFNEMVPRLRENVRLKKALELAHEVQQNLLPVDAPLVTGLDIAGAIVYSDETGGDYYDYLEFDETNDHKITVVVGDVSGHGIPSALLMTTARALFRQRSSMRGSITSIVSDVNKLLTRDVGLSGRFMTLFYMDLDTQKKQVKWLRAGHDPALVLDSNTGEFTELDGEGIFLGGIEDYEYKEYEREIHPGQIIAVGTDGVWEARNQQGDMFGKEAFKQIIADNAHEPAQVIMDKVFEAVGAFRLPVNQEDDITLVIIKVLK